MISAEAENIAAHCRHYAMCKIDFLGIGVCASGAARHFVAYYPQGRMDLLGALAHGRVPFTTGAADIADTCTLCGICDKQCHFVTGLRPLTVMRALKQFARTYREENGAPLEIAEDEILAQLRRIVGPEFAANDPALLVTYSHDPFPLKEPQMPRYVVLPKTRAEISAVLKLAERCNLPYAVRGNGNSVFGIVFSDGIILDLNRMQTIEIDRENWTARIEPGVTAFELQKAVQPWGLRANTAEPAATVCGNIVCTGIFSTWANIYGVAADNLVNAEFLDTHGNFFELNDKEAPNVFAFRNEPLPLPGICTKASVKLHPTTEDEQGLLIPFADLKTAVALARDLSQRRIGSSLAVLGGHYMATFLSPSAGLAEKFKADLPDVLGIRYVIAMVGDRYARNAVKEMTPAVIDNRLFRALVLGLPKLVDSEWADLMRHFESDRHPYEIFCREDLLPLIEAVLAPAPETLAQSVEDDLRDFYAGLYARPEMTDLIWLNTFRILSSRMARHKHVVAFLFYLPLDRPEVIDRSISLLAGAAAEHGLDHDYGFLTPLDLGKRAILEYDYYIDQTDPEDARKIKTALAELQPLIHKFTESTPGVKSLQTLISQGCSRKEHFLYL